MNRHSNDTIDAILRIRFTGQDRLGRGKMELLEHIRRTGSISAAGRAMDMSYRRAWLLVSDLNRMFDVPSVESQRGGQKGGGAVLTPFGEALLERFRAMEQAIGLVLADDLIWLQEHYRPQASPQE
ncbi:winged helix-turn-helix domain-containing protein [Rhizobium tumorigenes]|uniref:Winged helix-turn-helix domain-containing protein n=1 Tax=Rhizobium tumorigenes TaxID=2041385 RepID=A0AAF1K9J0_9HYPH|nr:winged helix-turn-helix domain-containing protein [Rhizobium tumorigenes]WFR95162.1 winged helix-turn-helix domain-containing protein [Rhizobium tumorigenes]